MLVREGMTNFQRPEASTGLAWFTNVTVTSGPGTHWSQPWKVREVARGLCFGFHGYERNTFLVLPSPSISEAYLGISHLQSLLSRILAGSIVGYKATCSWTWFIPKWVFEHIVMLKEHHKGTTHFVEAQVTTTFKFFLAIQASVNSSLLRIQTSLIKALQELMFFLSIDLMSSYY